MRRTRREGAARGMGRGRENQSTKKVKKTTPPQGETTRRRQKTAQTRHTKVVLRNETNKPDRATKTKGRWKQQALVSFRFGAPRRPTLRPPADEPCGTAWAAARWAAGGEEAGGRGEGAKGGECAPAQEGAEQYESREQRGVGGDRVQRCC